MLIRVTQEHIDASPRPGLGTKDPVTLALEEQLGSGWRYLGGNQIRHKHTTGQPLPDLGIVRIEPLVDGRRLNNVIKGWYRGELEPFEFFVPFEEEEDEMAIIDFQFKVLQGTRLSVRPQGHQNLVFEQPGAANHGFFINNDIDPPRDVNLVDLKVERSGVHADKFTATIPTTLLVPASSEALLVMAFELLENIPLMEPVEISVSGQEAA